MKNRYILYLLVSYVIFFNVNFAIANEFEFNVSEIIISEKGNITKAKKGTARSLTDGININANTFLYNKKKSTLTALGDVEITNIKNNFLIKTQGIIYDTYKKEILSEKNMLIKDEEGNIAQAEGFFLNLNSSIVKLKKMRMVDLQQNIIKLDVAFINLNTKKLIGKDVSINLNNKTFNKDNEPRLKGTSLTTNMQTSTLKKGVFTTCKRNDDCPPWQLQASEIRHDKQKKTIYYDNAWLKVYDKPVFYFPKFFHPDPTVKRQSGFLMPRFTDSSALGSSLNIPYFNVISDSKDLTFTPRVYFDNKILAQTELRTVDANSKNNLDFSLLNNPDGENHSHFFSKSEKKLNLDNFIDSDLYLNIQRTSDDTFLKTYDLKSPIINSVSTLESSVGLNLNKEDLTFNTEVQIYENLNADKIDRYEYVLPAYTLSKNLGYAFNTNVQSTFTSSGYIKNYNTNITEKRNINDLLYSSDFGYSKIGLQKNYNILLKNVNETGKNSPSFKEKRNHTIGSLFQYNLTYPLINEGKNYTDFLTPISTLNFSPSKSKNYRNTDSRIDVTNIFSLNRSGEQDSLEGGLSLVYGLEYFKTNKNNKNIFEANIANQIRLDEDKNLPINSSLGQKTSNFVGNFILNPSKYISLNYDYSIDENLSDTNYQSLSSTITVNNFVTTFEYVNENNFNENSFLSNETTYNFDESFSIGFDTRSNKETNITEYYNLIYQYKNDCLIAAVEYNKDYYSDRALKADESIFFKLTIIPFGETRSHNLRK
jgi:LPS-assembly protein